MSGREPPSDATLLRSVEQSLRALRKALHLYRKETGKIAPPVMQHRPAPMRPDGLARCVVRATREALVTEFAKGPVGAEVGVAMGAFTRHMLAETRVERLHLFDLNLTTLPQTLRGDPRVILHSGDSATNLAALDDEAFDWIYIDGDHRYAGVLRDARAAAERLKPDGTLFFNDYIRWSHVEGFEYGVCRVVHDLVNAGWDMVGIALTDHGYNDVALRRAPA